MPGRTITLNYAGTCKECGTTLHPGARARYYGRGRVYGVGCHADTRPEGVQARTQRGRGALTLAYPCSEDCLPENTEAGYALASGNGNG